MKLTCFTARNRRRLVSLFILQLILIQPIFAGQTSRAYGKSGTASNTNTQVVVPFNPLSIIICDDEASGGTAMFADITDGVATTADDSTNIKVLGGECISIKLADKDVLNTFNVGLITASSTAAYRVMAFR